MTLRMQVAICCYICCYLLYELWGLLGSGQRKMLRSWEPTFILFIMQIVVYKKQKLKTKTLSIIKISNSSLLICTVGEKDDYYVTRPQLHRFRKCTIVKKVFVLRNITASTASYQGFIHDGTVTFCDSTLNTANICPAISVVGLFYLLTVIMNFVCRFILGVDFTRRFRFCMYA